MRDPKNLEHKHAPTKAEHANKELQDGGEKIQEALKWETSNRIS